MKFTLNGQEVDAQDATSDTPLLYVLRNDMQLNGPKFGCGLGECGACAVLIDGKVARSCSVPLSVVEGKKVTTLEGLSPDASKAASAKALQDRAVLDVSAAKSEGSTPARTFTLHVVQQAFIDAQAAQCGYCTNGMIMALVGLFNQKPQASDDEIKQALSGHLCRCGTHVEIMQAAARARELIAQGRSAAIPAASTEQKAA
ncbi:(2Fe-2S)-binding protein [Comamonas resistens]|uniref:(2Fe-2S)-binding protein n=1 Tax=Comamonas resistens TaxID=3046670 RepID=A0ABY8SNZ6_9BURK|nr:(2Fe-2S)-binding protein [Comamonas resistens]MDL5037518.1 (2Fe-2S)-binding protein [Comamonas resistens]WHS64440.1 (2Fe-2S)-binding protein [Comamonas resistens]